MPNIGESTYSWRAVSFDNTLTNPDVERQRLRAFGWLADARHWRAKRPVYYLIGKPADQAGVNKGHPLIVNRTVRIPPFSAQ